MQRTADSSPSTRKSSNLLRQCFPSCTCTGCLSSGACGVLPCPKLEVNTGRGGTWSNKVVTEPRMKEKQNCSKMGTAGLVQPGRGLTALLSGPFQCCKMLKSNCEATNRSEISLRKQSQLMQTRSETTGISCFSVTLC